MGPRPLHLVDGNIPLPPLSPPLTAVTRKPNPRRQSSISYYNSGQVAESSKSPLSPPKDASRRSSVGPGSFSPQRDARVETPERQPLTLVEKHSELLHFIAQKESKCLELRSQLAANEAELLQLKRKWERIVNRGLLDTPTSPPSSNAVLSGHGAVLDGIVEGVQGVGRFIASGLPTNSSSASPVHSPPSSSRPLRPTHLNSQSSSSVSTSTIKSTFTSASTRLSQSSASSLGEDGYPDSVPLLELNEGDEKEKRGDDEHTQILMVDDTGATPTMSPNPTFEHHRQQQQRIQHSQAANFVTLPNTSKLYRRRSRSPAEDEEPKPIASRPQSPSPLFARSRSPSPPGEDDEEKLEAKRLKRATINGTSFPPVSSIPGLATLTVGQAVAPVPSWIGSVGKKWDELQRGSTSVILPPFCYLL
ncbi:hypothetical protein H0H92_010383 [Tricholoma furcatifolium]|nr:hypothetical protein H0H92_010383 [Tricholoma furcatifolium]